MLGTVGLTIDAATWCARLDAEFRGLVTLGLPTMALASRRVGGDATNFAGALRGGALGE